MANTLFRSPLHEQKEQNLKTRLEFSLNTKKYSKRLMQIPILLELE